MLQSHEAVCAHKIVHDLFENQKIFSQDIRLNAELFLNNEQGFPLVTLPEQPIEYTIMGAVIAHTVSVISSEANLPILIPLYNMMNYPGALKVS